MAVPVPDKNHCEEARFCFYGPPARPCANESNGDAIPTREKAGPFRFATAVDEIPLAYCRQCDAWIPVAAIGSLSIHRTSAGLVTYFRCSAGHCDFYTTKSGASAPRDGAEIKLD